jgi:predicted site-specific integrase-resolvase
VNQATGKETNSESLVSGRELAAAFGVAITTVNRWRRRGLLPHVRVSRGCVRYRVADAIRAFERGPELK